MSTSSNWQTPNELEKAIGYQFTDKKYLRVALTHSSFANEVKSHVECNERQEFLGDAVLSIVVSDYIFANYKACPEGELTKLRASLVCEKSLCQFAKQFSLGDYLLLGHGEELMGGRDRSSILADAFESLLAAIYLDGGMEPAKKFVLGFVTRTLGDDEKIAFRDYKTILQEIIQKNPEERLIYALVEENGPDHDKHFVVEVHLNSNVIGRGEGRSKKTAEQAAAREALALMGE